MIVIVPALMLGARKGPELQPWHLLAPTAELTVDEIGDDFDFDSYLELEETLFAELDRLLETTVEASPELALSRYSRGGVNDPATFPTNWNRSYEVVPDQSSGAALLIHGLTDSPYSLRAIGSALAGTRLAVVGLRLPGHGTVPEALDRVARADWRAAVRIALQRAHSLQGDGPLIVVGYSTGAALALEAAMDALEDPGLVRADRIIMISPAVGITRFAVLAGLPRLQRFVPFFGRLRWTDVMPEIDPFKYSSFPANGGWLTHRLTVSNRERLLRLAGSGRAAELPPITAFVSLADATVLVESVLTDLFEPLADSRNELVVFDVNRLSSITTFFKHDPAERLAWLADRASLRWNLTVITNADPESRLVVEKRWAAGSRQPIVTALDLEWPPGVFSLSHIAVPFPSSDPIYGYDAQAPDWGLALGRLEPRGEKDLLSLDLGFLMRLRSNPFFPYLEERLLNVANGADQQ